MVSMSRHRRCHARYANAVMPGIANASSPFARNAKPAPAPAAASHATRARPEVVSAANSAHIVSATIAVNIGSSVVTPPSTIGMTVVACTRNATGPSSRRPEMRAASHAAQSAVTIVARALGSRIAKASCPSTEMLAAVAQYMSGGFS